MGNYYLVKDYSGLNLTRRRKCPLNITNANQQIQTSKIGGLPYTYKEGSGCSLPVYAIT